MKFAYSATFKRQLKRLRQRYRNIKSDLLPIMEGLESGEILGDPISGYSMTLYKIRVPNRDSRKGKSGGYRVIYYLKSDIYIILATIYSKSDQGDISTQEVKDLLREIKSLE